MSLLLRSAGSLGRSMLGRDNSRGTLSLWGGVYHCKGPSLQWKVVEQLAKLMGDVTAATGVCGRSGKEVFVEGKGFEMSGVLAKHVVFVV